MKAALKVYLNAYSNGYNEAAYHLGWLYNTKGDLYNLEKVYKWWESYANNGFLAFKSADLIAGRPGTSRTKGKYQKTI